MQPSVRGTEYQLAQFIYGIGSLPPNAVHLTFMTCAVFRRVMERSMDGILFCTSKWFESSLVRPMCKCMVRINKKIKAI